VVSSDTILYGYSSDFFRFIHERDEAEDTQIHKRRFFISAKEKNFAELKNRLLCICFVRKVISLDDFTDTHYKMTISLFVNSENSMWHKVTRGTFICAQIEVHEYTNRIFSVDVEH